jgi:hypothetical protein
MSSVASIQPSTVAFQSSRGSAATSSGELAKCESQLSDWVHCASSKTSAGKAKIAEITNKIDSIKADMKKADESKTAALREEKTPPMNTVHRLRFDGLGTWVNLQA